MNIHDKADGWRVQNPGFHRLDVRALKLRRTPSRADSLLEAMRLLNGLDRYDRPMQLEEVNPAVGAQGHESARRKDGQACGRLEFFVFDNSIMPSLVTLILVGSLL